MKQLKTFCPKLRDCYLAVDKGKRGKKHPVVLLIHGNFGLGTPYGNQIHGFAKDLAGRGYLTVVPQYYHDDNPRPDDTVPYVQTLADAITTLAGRSGADLDRLGLIGFSLGKRGFIRFLTKTTL